MNYNKKILIIIVILVSFSCKKKENNWTFEISNLKHSYIDNQKAVFQILNKSYKNFNDDVVFFKMVPAQYRLDSCQASWKIAFNDFILLDPFKYVPSNDNINYSQSIFLLDSYPINYSYIDYTSASTTTGIVNRSDLYPEITTYGLESWNTVGGSNNISCGFHALEFLLWGEDNSLTTAGIRDHNDFLSTSITNDRRRTFLAYANENLLNEIKKISFTQADETAILNMDSKLFMKNMLTGLSDFISNDFILKGIQTPLNTQNHKDEISDFSDNTMQNLKSKYKALECVFYGILCDKSNSYAYFLEDFIKEVDPTKMDQINASLLVIKTDLNAINVDFEVAITNNTYKAKLNNIASELNKINVEITRISSLF